MIHSNSPLTILWEGLEMFNMASKVEVGISLKMICWLPTELGVEFQLWRLAIVTDWRHSYWTKQAIEQGFKGFKDSKSNKLL